jgi:transposase
VAELGDWRRFESPRALMAYLGLVASEHSSGGKERRGAITKAGNVRLRRLLVEAAWHYRHRPAVGYRLRKRLEGQPARVIAIADRAQQRLHSRYQRLTARGKPHNKEDLGVPPRSDQWHDLLEESEQHFKAEIAPSRGAD